MEAVAVCHMGLRALAGQCAASAARLANQVPTAVAGPPTQATASAASNAYAALGATAVILASRIQATGDKLTLSASQYGSTDETTARQLSELSYGPGLR